MQRSFRFWQWETLLVTMAGYAIYYVVRKNLSLALPLIGEEFGISKVQLGAFLTLHGLVYGFSRFVNGVLTDRSSARKVMAAGLFACAVVNLLFGLSDGMASWLAGVFGRGGSDAFTVALVWTMGVVWIANGYFQGMGVGPCVKTIPQWFPPNELATKQSIWNLSHSIGAGGVFALLGWWIIPTFHAWRLCFIVPAALAFAGSAGLLLAMRNSPEELGFPAVKGHQAAPVKTPEERADYRRFVRINVLCNPAIWILAVSNFFMNTVRFAALDWGPTLLMEAKGLSLAAATTLCFAFEIVGGNLGILAAGWASDRIFASRTHRTCALCFAGVSLSVVGFWLVPSSAPFALKLLPFAAIGFFLYGPQALLGVASTQQATPRAAASANGVLGISGYLSTIVSGVGFGWMAGRWGWTSVFVTMLASAVLGGAVVAMMWKAPASSQKC